MYRFRSQLSEIGLVAFLKTYSTTRNIPRLFTVISKADRICRMTLAITKKQWTSYITVVIIITVKIQNLRLLSNSWYLRLYFKFFLMNRNINLERKMPMMMDPMTIKDSKMQGSASLNRRRRCQMKGVSYSQGFLLFAARPCAYRIEKKSITSYGA